ncbi:MAG: GatB/YqeY domain-containing protein, partial [Planctomycetia bacterium]|nr:GatB/YqeY domain-containing protein [Planctomycetia bacterium]
MKLFEKIQTDMYKAMKAKDIVKSKTLRVVFAKLKDQNIAKREDLSEAEELKVLQSLAKQHKESITMFRNGGRDDLVEQESKELQIIEQYLPKMMADDEIKNIVKNAIEETGAQSLSDIGKVMPIIM